MIVVGSNPYGAASTERVAAFEAHIGHALPSDYRQFLITVNGGKPEQPLFAIPDEGTDRVRYFCGLHDGPNYHNLDSPLQTYRDHGRMPLELIPIASDSFGNWVCLGIAGTVAGNVYFWDHERESEGEDGPTWDNIVLLANSFTEFVAGLQADTSN